jgi:hypothetical protein
MGENVRRYYENFKSVKDVHEAFSIDPSEVLDEEILFAYYGSGSYCGSATVLYHRDGKLYEVSSSHCSCYGLEDTWEPSEITWEQLAVRNSTYFEDDYEGAEDRFKALINEHAPRA